MPLPERPRLRPTVIGHIDPENTEVVWLYDRYRVSRFQLALSRQAIPILELFNGSNDLRDVQVALMRFTGGQLFPLSILEQLVGRLDEALLLDGPRVQDCLDEFHRSSVREPSCLDSYGSDPEEVRQLLLSQFQDERGSGLPANVQPDGELRGALIPHIDYHRGGPVYSHAFKELVERSDASVFVIIGTSHYSGSRYILTRKDFKTPLGIAETDKDYVNRLATYYGNRAFEDEVAHLPEHSIELEVVFLQYLLEGKRAFRIVPLLVGSFQDCIDAGIEPREQSDIYLMIQALRRAEAESGEKVCYISSGDLAHIGPKFGDEDMVSPLQLDHSERQDHVLLDQLAGVDRGGFFQVLHHERDERRICGFPPTYTLLSVLEPERGRVLAYDQYVEPRGLESVSFASVAFYGTTRQ
jgi:hypothetical protein